MRRVFSGNFEKPACLQHALAVEDAVADGGERQGDELAVALGVALEARIVAAVFPGEALRDVGHVEQLVGILMSVVEPDQHDVGPRADIGGHGGLRADVLPALLVDAHLDAGRLGELLGVGEPGILIAFDEGRPAQDAQGRALLGLEARSGGLGEGRLGAEAAEPGGSREAGAAEEKVAS